MAGPIEVVVRDRVLEVGLAAPKGNVLDSAMLRALRAVFRDNTCDPHLLAVLLRAQGPHFSFGASVEEHRPEHAARMLAELHGLLREIWDLQIPCVAAVRGACLGGGLELALCASFLVAAPDARFAAPEIKLGVFAPFASAILPFRVGLAHAERLLLSGEPLDAATALRIGLCDEIALDPEARARALIGERLAGKSASSLRFALRAARLPVRAQIDEALARLERLYLDELLATQDAREGIAAFIDKRPPSWKDA
jgi:cyclohexa-1,5-dienecarbonyl-CoA hydratase